MHDIETLVAFVNNNSNKPSPRGVSCKFVKLDNKWGVKIYTSDDERDLAVSQQKIMNEKGFAPAVSTVFNVGVDMSCYITELAKPLVEPIDRKYRDDDSDWNLWRDRCAEFNSKNPNIEAQIRNLCEDMAKAVNGYSNHDRHLGNFGYMEDGRLVCIDFGY